MQVYLVEAAVAAALLLAAPAYRDRPRGWARSDLVATGASPLAGTGLFARADIAAGTVLGAYPVRPRTEPEMRAKAASAPAVAQYVFSTSESRPYHRDAAAFTRASGDRS